MTEIKEDSIVITIDTAGSPQEYYQDALVNLVQVLKMQDASYGDTTNAQFYLLDLIQNMVEIKHEPCKNQVA